MNQIRLPDVLSLENTDELWRSLLRPLRWDGPCIFQPADRLG